MDKIKITEITHLMARIRALMDDQECVCAAVNNNGYGDVYLYLGRDLFKGLFEEYETSRFDDDLDQLSTRINGVNVFCFVERNEHAH